VTNSVSVGSQQYDRDPLNSTHDEQTRIVRQADLAISKAGNAIAVAGSNYAYTITVENIEFSDASGVVVSDTLPNGVSFVPSFGHICSASGQVLACTLPDDLQTATSYTFTVPVFITSTLSDGAELENRASVSAIEYDPIQVNNTTDHDATVSRRVDLTIRKEGQSDTAVVGKPFTYTLWITNVGPSEARQVTVTDTLPISTTFSESSIDCDPSADEKQRFCDVGVLPAGEVVSFTMKLLVNADAPHGIDIENIATVGAAEFEHVDDKDDNTTSVTTMIERLADISIDKTDNGADATAGDFYTYTVTITNSGPSEASNIVVTDTLPAHTTFARSANATCNQVGLTRDYECEFANLANESSITFSVTVAILPDAPDGKVVTNTVKVTATETDLVPDNIAKEPTTVVRESDLLVTKSDNGRNAVAGAGYAYTVTVQNLGPSDASQVILIDTLPAGTWMPGAPPAGCTNNGATIDCASTTPM
jgi:uncharacterized repeat protein (TIGR01451 family)